MAINPFSRGHAQAHRASLGQRAVPGERFALMKAANKIPPLRVVPAPGREHLRKILVHPNGVRLRNEGSTEWPNDRFTQRRIDDGDIKIAEENAEAKSAPAPSGRRASHSSE